MSWGILAVPTDYSLHRFTQDYVLGSSQPFVRPEPANVSFGTAEAGHFVQSSRRRWSVADWTEFPQFSPQNKMPISVTSKRGRYGLYRISLLAFC